jgi:hypothetical protein
MNITSFRLILITLALTFGLIAGHGGFFQYLSGICVGILLGIADWRGWQKTWIGGKV